MNDEKDCYDVAEPRPYEFDFPASISIPVERSSVAKFERVERRHFFRAYAWTCGNIGGNVCGSEKMWRRSGAKSGRRLGDLQHYIWVSPDCFCGIRPILSGFCYPDLGFAVFAKIYFAPKRKAAKVAGKLLKSPDLWGGETARKFRRVPEKTEITLVPFGRVDVY